MNIRKALPLIAVIWFFAAILIRPDLITGLWEKISALLTPIITGMIIAAIIDPAVTKTKKLIMKSQRFKETAARGIAIALVYLLIAAVIAAALWIILPSLIESAKLFINSLDGYYSDFRKRYDNFSGSDHFGILGSLDRILDAASSKLPELFGKTYKATADFIRGIGYLAVGVVLSVYMLAGKEKLLEFSKGVFSMLLPPEKLENAVHVIKTADTCLVNFISGQLTEAFFLGTLCFIGMVIFGFEYPLLISTIIGVTALVPVVGAIAGTIPSALMLFLVKPISALWFIIFIIILQQLENNIIYPKVVGKSVGLPPILILIAIVWGVQFGGALGIMIGIPLLSALYVLIGEKCSKQLSRKTRPQ